MTDLDLSAADLRRALHDLTDTVRPAPDEAWAALLPRLSAVADGDADGPSDDGDGPDATVVELATVAPRRHRLRISAVAAVAAAVLLAGLTVVVPRLGRGDIAADRAAPWLLLPTGTPLRLQQARLSPADLTTGHTIVLADEDVTRGYVVRAEPGVDQSFAIAPSAAGSGPETVTVHGASGRLAGANLWWNEAGAALSVTALGAVDRAELLAVADGVTVAADGTPAAGVVPAGLAVRVDGPDAEVLPATRYTVDYTAEDLDAPFDDSVQVSVVDGGRVDAVLALLAVFAPGPPRAVDVRGHRATVRSATVEGVATVAVAWEERAGVLVTTIAYGLAEDEVLGLVRGLRTVDEAAWRAEAGQALVDEIGASTATTAPAAVVASGAIEGAGWSLRRDDPVDTGSVCLTLETGSLTAGGCGERLGRLAVVGNSAVTGGAGTSVAWLVALVADDVDRVDVVDRAGAVVTQAARAEATGVGGVVVLRYAVDRGAELVAYDGAGARLTSQALPTTPSGAPVPLMTFPDVESLNALPVLGAGTLEGRTWQVRAGRVRLLRSDEAGTQVPTDETALCASIDFAKRTQLAFTCENDRSGVPGIVSIGVTTSPRTFLVALTAPGIDRVTVGWADGTTTEVEAARAAGDERGVAVVPVPRGSRVVSLATSAGRATVDVPGEADAAVSLPEPASLSGP